MPQTTRPLTHSASLLPHPVRCWLKSRQPPLAIRDIHLFQDDAGMTKFQWKATWEITPYLNIHVKTWPGTLRILQKGGHERKVGRPLRKIEGLDGIPFIMNPIKIRIDSARQPVAGAIAIPCDRPWDIAHESLFGLIPLSDFLNQWGFVGRISERQGSRW
jgi:hypothetical protein